MVELSGVIEDVAEDQVVEDQVEETQIVEDQVEPEVDATEEQQVEPDSTAAELNVIEKILEYEQACTFAEGEVEDAKAKLKEAKARYDNCVVRLRKFIRGIYNDRDRPLFTQPAEQESETEDQEDPPELWRDVPLDELNLPKGIYNKLTENDVATAGDLEDLRGEISLGRKEWPKGIGRAKVDIIETVIVEFIAANQLDGFEVEEEETETTLEEATDGEKEDQTVGL